MFMAKVITIFNALRFNFCMALMFAVRTEKQVPMLYGARCYMRSLLTNFIKQYRFILVVFFNAFHIIVTEASGNAG